MSTEPESDKPSRNFLKRLYDELKASGDLSFDSFQSAVRKARAHAGGKAKAEKAKTVEAAESLSAFINRVQNALYDEFRNDYSGVSPFSYAKEVFDNYVIACSNDNGKDYKIPFQILNDEIQFGEPVEVATEYVVVGVHEVADLCADGHGIRLFMEQNFAEPPEWINYLPKPGTYESPHYGTITITKERNQNFVDNFSKAVYQSQLPVDAEHETKLSGACAWLTAMRVNEDGSVDAKPEWTDRGKAFLESDSYKYFSPEWYEKWVDPATQEVYSDVAIGGALTTRPFFKEKALRPLVANERGLFVLDNPQNLNSESVVNLYFTALSPVENSEGVEPNMPDDKVQTGTETVDPQKFAEVQTQLTEAQTKLTAAETELANAKTQLQAAEEKANKADERITSLEKDARAKRFSEMSKEWVGDNKIHLATLEHFSQIEGGEDSDLFKNYVTTQNAAAEQIKKAGLFTEIGSNQPAEGSAVATAEGRARQMSEGSGGKKPFAVALDEVLESDPQLRAQYHRETRAN
jgi:phage I-like protein